MLNKLALSGIKHRVRDYSVLFSVLMIASAIFYMFMSLATNKAFLSSNSPASATSFIFAFGIVLLAIITIVYVNYANTFLLSMREKEYGMFMMLGAKSSKISRMIFVETFAIGAISTIIGTLVGILATGFVSRWLISALDMQVKHFDIFYLPAFLSTVAFFIIIFMFSAIKNSISLRRSKVLTLLKRDSQPVKVKRNGVMKTIQAVLGLILLGIGYFTIYFSGHNPGFIMAGIPVALVTIVGGTYFTINSFVTAVIVVLKKNTKYSQKGLNNFTLSQLSFRINDYTKILSMVSMMFALALGAITVGLGFNNQIDNVVNGQNYYDVQVTNPNAAQQKRLKSLSVEKKDTYNYKTDGKKVYYRASEFKKQPVGYAQMNSETMQFKLKTSNDPNKNSNAKYELMNTRMPAQRTMDAAFVSDAEYNAINAKETTSVLVKTNSFKNNLATIKAISKAESQRYPALKNNIGDKYSSYTLVNGFFSGLEFMGFFLGIAFLAMLASCLMFKILSGANSDVKRYNMLYKIGTK